MTRGSSVPAIRRPAAILRSLSPSTVAALVLVLVLGGAGGAGAANGGSFLLGKANAETAKASLSNSQGTPLALSAPPGKAPLAVSRNTLVKNLNAEYLGGLSSTQLQATGGAGFSPLGASDPIDSHGEIVASTGSLPAGTYYVIATAWVGLGQGDTEAACYLIKGSDPGTFIAGSGAQQGTQIPAATTAILAIGASDTFQEKCFTDGDHGSGANDAGVLAIRILSSSPGSGLASAAR